MKINEKMKELRTQLHLSQDYVAKYLGVNRSTVARSFDNLDDTDKAEIMNLIRFKEQMKAQRSK